MEGLVVEFCYIWTEPARPVRAVALFIHNRQGEKGSPCIDVVAFNLRVRDAFQTQSNKVSVCWGAESTTTSTTQSKTRFQIDVIDYLPPRRVRISLQQLDKISRLKAERCLPRSRWCAMVVPHCHHLGTWKHDKAFEVSVHRGEQEKQLGWWWIKEGLLLGFMCNIARWGLIRAGLFLHRSLASWLIQWSKKHTIKAQHPAFYIWGRIFVAWYPFLYPLWSIVWGKDARNSKGNVTESNFVISNCRSFPSTWKK